MAQEEIGGLSVSLSLETQQYLEALGKARAKLDTESQHMQSSFKKLGETAEGLVRPIEFLRAAIGALIVGEFARMAKEAIDSVDALAKTADAVGLNVEKLQEYTYAGQLAGVETQDLYKALEVFTKNVGDARAGTGTLITVLKNTNPELLKNVLAAKGTSEAFNVAANALAGMTDETQRASIAQALFGRDGAKIVNLTKDGAKGIAAMGQEARDLGLVLSEDVARKAEQANDALARAAETIKTQLTHALINATPAITQAANALAQLIGRLSQDLFPDHSKELATYESGLATLQQRLQNLGAQRDALVAKQKTAGFFDSVAAKLAIRSIDSESEAIQHQIVELLPLIAAGKQDEQTDKARTTAKQGLIGMTQQQIEAEVKLQETQSRAANEALGYSDDLKTQRAEMERGVEITKENQTVWEKQRATMDELNKEYKDGYIDLGTYNRAVEKLDAGLTETQKTTNDTRDVLQELGATFSSAFEDAVVNGNSLHDVLQGLEKDLIRIFLRLSVEKPLLNYVLGAADYGPGTNGVNATGVGQGIGGAAAGGPVSAGRSYFVGELGPELFTPATHGHITPAAQSGRGGTTVYLDARGADAGTVARLQAALRQLDASIEPRAYNATIGWQRRGGR